MKKEIIDLYLKAHELLTEEREAILSMDKESFLIQYNKQKRITGDSLIAIFGDKDYKPYFTQKDRKLFLYLLNNRIFNKFVFDTKRPKREYQIERGDQIHRFIIKDRYKDGGVYNHYFITTNK